ncbi:MAG: BON domain-containing protein [Candidatus Lokiarchaeota archaeon]|nr:BON domain-containing protein [Candidatus Lokiarchaeota archaeon]
MSKTQEQIKKDVVDTLYWDARVDASNIKVSMEDENSVKLEGTVPSYSARSSAVRDAWMVSDVNFVKNEIDVEYPPELKLTDEDIKSNIESKLLWSSSIDSSKIDVSVTGGIITIEGAVDSYWKKLHAENLASEVAGVLSIDNKITVVPTEDFLDKTVAEDIVEAMDRNFNINVNKVNVKVKNGVITLTGTVSSWTEYRAAMNCAENTPGVIDIKDKIKIEY